MLLLLLLLLVLHYWYIMYELNDILQSTPLWTLFSVWNSGWLEAFGRIPTIQIECLSKENANKCTEEEQEEEE